QASADRPRSGAGEREPAWSAPARSSLRTMRWKGQRGRTSSPPTSAVRAGRPRTPSALRGSLATGCVHRRPAHLELRPAARIVLVDRFLTARSLETVSSVACLGEVVSLRNPQGDGR